ncbi:MAG: exodeoxyribonuclease VII large subunit, partial [Lachnospiraceae bacterium]|nr:exodeoxyribonuclease VII large subunit [Lachnospiraceae bacterium]
PRYIKTLGVVTADTGAAIRDIIQITKRRNPYVQIILYPAIVQGDGAAPSIVKGIKALEEFGVDVMIVGRGGGSIEDLWGFNDRTVAQAVFDCSIPIISAVGHEIDFTIIDFVADMRAPTPSAAAELAVYEFDKFEENLEGYREGIKREFSHLLDSKRRKVSEFENSLKFLSPGAKLQTQKNRLEYELNNLKHIMDRLISDKKNEMLMYAEKLKGLSPLEKLSSGYSYVTDEKGTNIKSVEKIHKGMQVNIRFSDGSALAEIKDINI